MNHVNVKKIDKFIPWIFVLFFIMIACVDTVFMTMAIKTQTGLVTDKAYETGLKYNDIIKASDDQKKLGWSHDVNISNQGAIEFILKDKQGKPITGADISLLCFRPVRDGMDIKTKLVEASAGIYTAHPSYSADGLWQIFVTAKAKGFIYKASQEITIQR